MKKNTIKNVGLVNTTQARARSKKSTEEHKNVLCLRFVSNIVVIAHSEIPARTSALLRFDKLFWGSWYYCHFFMCLDGEPDIFKFLQNAVLNSERYQFCEMKIQNAHNVDGNKAHNRRILGNVRK